jgi:Activator of Hsp90 ATPase homolog 1-like protein
VANIIKHQFFFPHPPEAVWEYLTKPELMERWLMKNNFQPIVGLDFQFREKPIPSLDFDGIFYCKENLSFYNGLADGWVKNIQKMTNHLNAAQHSNTNA